LDLESLFFFLLDFFVGILAFAIHGYGGLQYGVFIFFFGLSILSGTKACGFSGQEQTHDGCFLLLVKLHMQGSHRCFY
jgi:hypothetical protein